MTKQKNASSAGLNLMTAVEVTFWCIGAHAAAVLKRMPLSELDAVACVLGVATDRLKQQIAAEYKARKTSRTPHFGPLVIKAPVRRRLKRKS